MDVLELLKSDHERVADLLDQIEALDKKSEQWRIFQTIKRELQAHAHAEETVFYPAFSRYDELKDIVKEAYEEHTEVKNKLSEIDKAGRESDQVEDLVSSLRECVDHHVEEEENDMFPRVRQIMKRGEREVLGRHIMAAKTERQAA
jgi:hemerythrin superfamily protein